MFDMHRFDGVPGANNVTDATVEQSFFEFLSYAVTANDLRFIM